MSDRTFKKISGFLSFFGLIISLSSFPIYNLNAQPKIQAEPLPLPSVILLSPQQGVGVVDLTPTYKWHATGTGILTNVLYVDTDLNPFSGGTAYLVDKSQTHTPLFDELTAGERYYWGVAVSDDNGTTYSTVQSFTPLNSNQGGAFESEIDITTDANAVWFIHPADVDSDGDIDMLAALIYDNKIVWYENKGDGSYDAHTITSSAIYARAVYAADLDGDGDMDVLSASEDDDKIAWYKNDGNENFTAINISTAANGAWVVSAADMDGDGDMDVQSASLYDDKLVWYENDGSENFTALTITDDAEGAMSLYTIDFDSDGDMDVLCNNFWYENDGAQTFTKHLIASGASDVRSVYAADMDGDGDIDALSASIDIDRVAWYENDGSENFTVRIIASNAIGANSVYACDMDGDGDMDVLTAPYYDNKFLWYENNGNEVFESHEISSGVSYISAVSAADMDEDGDMDILLGSLGVDKISWYENTNQQAGVTVSFSDGSGYSPSFMQSVQTQPFGRFSLLADTLGAELIGATFTLNGARNGMSNFKLWKSTDDVFNSAHDTTLGATVVSDPGDGSTISFSGFNNAIDTTTRYYFITCDLSSNAGGGIQAIVTDSADLSMNGGILSGTITNEALSDGDVLDVGEPSERDLQYVLDQNYPNPFNPSTTIQYSLLKRAKVELVVYNVLGQMVRTLVRETKPAGNYQTRWDGLDNRGQKVSSGIYFYRLKSSGFTQVKKMMLVK